MPTERARLNPTKVLRLIDRAAEVNGARPVIALLPRLVELAVTKRKGATALQVSRESAMQLTAFGSGLREHAPLCWKRIPKRVSVSGKRPRVLEYRDETAVLLHDRPRDVRGAPNGRVQIGLIGSVAGKKPGVRETFRRAYATALAEVDADGRLSMRPTGHQSMSTHNLYVMRGGTMKVWDAALPKVPLG